MNFLDVENKNFLVTGVANKKSIAYFVAKKLKEYKANIVLSVHPLALEKVKGLFPDDPIYTCDVSIEKDFCRLAEDLKQRGTKIDGLLHSIAFANYKQGAMEFTDTNWQDFQEATRISSFSLVSFCGHLKKSLADQASVVTLSISNTKATSYGYMGPIKATLDAMVPFLAKSLAPIKVRVNAVCSGPLKTTASAGIPNYINNYLYSEKLTLRKENLRTDEVANTVLFLLSQRSSGINGEKIIVDAGMGANYFDQEVVEKVVS